MTITNSFWASSFRELLPRLAIGQERVYIVVNSNLHILCEQFLRIVATSGDRPGKSTTVYIVVNSNLHTTPPHSNWANTTLADKLGKKLSRLSYKLVALQHKNFVKTNIHRMSMQYFFE